MRFPKTSLVLAVLLMTASVYAADSTKAGAPPGMPPMGAPAEMKQVAFMVGDWDVAAKYNMGDTTKWTETKCSSKISSVLSGASLMSTFDGVMMGMPYSGVGYTCYKRETGQWQMSWVDNMDAFLSLYTGTLKDGKFVFTGEDTYQGKPMVSRMTYSNMSNDKFEWQMDMSMDGGKTFMTGMKATYTRAKK